MGTKIVYEEPKHAKYKLLVPRFDGTFDKYKLRCDVLGETDRSYKIKILEFCPRHTPGDIFYVHKKSVILDEPTEVKSGDLSDFWYNNIESREIL